MNIFLFLASYGIIIMTSLLVTFSKEGTILMIYGQLHSHLALTMLIITAYEELWILVGMHLFFALMFLSKARVVAKNQAMNSLKKRFLTLKSY